MLRILIAPIIFFSLVIPGVAFANTSEVNGFIAVGPALAPDYEGSTDYKAIPLVVARVQSNGYFVELQGTRARANLLPIEILSDSLSLSVMAGPSVNFRPGRGSVENARVDSLRDVDTAIEAGAFIALRKNGILGERDALMGRIELVNDVSGTHEGRLLTLRGSYAKPLSKKLRFAAGMDATYASNDYMETYFSIDADNAGRSGLTAFKSGHGLKDVGLDLSLLYSLTERWGIMGLVRTSYLLGDASDSPIAGEGSSKQFLGGIAVNYRF